MQVLSSKQVAEVLGKRHDNFIRDIRKYIERLGSEAPLYFVESSYKDKTGTTRFCYDVTVAGCELIAGRMIGGGKAFLDKCMEILQPVELIPEKYRYTVQEVAEELGINDRTVYRYIDRGLLRAEVVEILVPTYRKLITAEDFEEFKAKRGIA